MEQTHQSNETTQQAIDDFKRRMERITHAHQQAVTSTIQQAIERDLEALFGPPKSSPFTSIHRTSQHFAGHIGKWVRKGTPFSRGAQEPTMTQTDAIADLDNIIDAEFTVLDPEEPVQQTVSHRKKKQL